MKMTNRAQEAHIIKRELEISDEFCKAALESSARHDIAEAKIAALQEANKQLAEQLDRREAKLNILVEKIGAERIGKLFDAASFERAAKLLEKMAEEAQKEAEKEGAKDE